jgi:hypothetical protein
MQAARGVVLMLAGLCLVAGVAGGLLRLGIPVGLPSAPALVHGALMIGFLGAVIGLERAVAFGGAPALFVPLAAACGSLALLAGWRGAAEVLLVAPVLLVVLSAAIVHRQVAQHTVLLTLAAVAWCVGNVLFVTAAPAMSVAAWWLAFVVLTVAAERIELTRLMPRRRGTGALFAAAAALLVAGAALLIASPQDGIVYGAGLVAISLWLARFDLARRTLRTAGFARYSACALLAGYAWLAVGGVAWIALSWNGGARDVALHAVALGFVASMIFAHAPLMVPVILRVRMRYSPAVYVPLGLLHGSLLLRLGPGLFDAHLRQWGGMLNAAAFVLFAATLVYGAKQKGPAPSDAGANATR